MARRVLKVAAVFALAAGVLLVMFLSQRWSSAGEIPEILPKKYRFIALYSGDNEAFQSTLGTGLLTAAEDSDAWVTFHTYSSSDLESHARGFEEAIAARADGIITSVPSTAEIGRLIDRAALRGIPVVTIVDDIYGSQRKAYIGVDYESFGNMAARVMGELTGGSARTAVISYPLSKQNQECTRKISGFANGIAKYENLRMGIEHVGELDYINTYSLAQEILDSGFGYDSFFCIDETITLAVAQCLSDNGIRDMPLVGCGESMAIRDLVREGVIDAVLTENPYYIGHEAVTSMVRYVENGGLPYMTAAEIYIATADNLQDYYYEADP